MRLLKPVVTLLMVAFATVATAQTLSEINKLSGLDRALEGMNAAVVSGIDQIPGEKPADFVEAWKAASADAFNGPRMLAAIEAKMDGKLTPDQLTKLHAFYSSDLGKAATAAEVAATGKAAELAAQGPKLFTELPQKDPERLALYARLIEGLDLYTSAEAVALNVGYGILSGMTAAQKTPLSNEEIMALIRQGQQQTRQAIEQQINFATAFTYKDIPLDQLKAYVEFLETPEAGAYYDQMTTSMGDVMGEESKQFGDNLYRALGIKKA